MESMTRAQQELYDWLVEYIETTQHPPSIRQMMRAMNLRSPAPIQSRLERLRSKGYIDWTEGKARTLQILHQKSRGISLLGEVSEGSQVEPHPETEIIRQASKSSQRPAPGLCKGMITIMADDNEHLQDFAEYMP